MELLQTENFYILNNEQESLWFNRKTGDHECKTCWDMAAAKNPICLGVVHALLGKIQILPDVSPRLVMVTEIEKVGNLDSKAGQKCLVCCITQVIFLPIVTLPDFELNLQQCHKHHTIHPNSVTQDRKNILPFGDFQQKVGLSKTFGTIRNVTSSIKTATVNAAANATGQNKARKDCRDRERFERRILDELSKMFNESKSFYYCNNFDLTSSLQRQNDSSYDLTLPLWKRADDRFFWNKHLLEKLQNGSKPLPDCWLVPVIQGYIQIENVPLPLDNLNIPTATAMTKDGVVDGSYSLILISRRSRKRAGTRYKRRGVDEEGNVANYVETEQIVQFSHHRVAFLQVRGSVPVFWSQPGYKYRPPPRLDKGPEETASAFKKHFDNELEVYEKVTCISLVEQAGKEKVIADAFLNHVMLLDLPSLTYVSFDFHEYCRGMRYENVAVLVEGIEKIIGEMLYCWVDKEGVICRQNGVFRVNCIDCLDRTNVVQTALGRAVLEHQFAKLGIIPPDHTLPANCRAKLQSMWANNGDTISKQYAGTSALKGDFTRTGERNFAGLMKDGMNSANRYYLNRFKDAYRQATIDTMLGHPISEDLLSLNPEVAAGEEEEASLAQHVKHVIDDCKKLLVPDAETILGAWGLIDADPTSGDPEQTDMDVILVLTRDSYYVAQYDEEADRILRFERVSLIDLSKIELGPFTFQGMFKQSRTHFCIRFNYQMDGQTGYFHMFRSMNIRFFNNMAVTIRTEEEILESMKTIGDTFEVASQMMGCEVVVCHGKLERKKSRGRSVSSSPFQLLSPIASFTKTSPDSLKSVGTRAFSNMTSGLAKLNPMSSLRPKRPIARDRTSVGNSQFYSQQPIVSVVYSSRIKSKKEVYLPSCGIVASSVPYPLYESPHSLPPPGKSFSDTQIFMGHLPLSPFCRPVTPEILVSGTTDLTNAPGASPKKVPGKSNFLSTDHDRVRKLSHSSDEVDSREDAGTAIQRASSATELDLKLNFGCSASAPSEGRFFPVFFGTDGPKLPSAQSPLSPLSPLSSFNKETVLSPFSVLARGVQSLAPGAEKFAKGVQNIGANLDPRKLKMQRQKQMEENLEMKARILKCNSVIIQF